MDLTSADYERQIADALEHLWDFSYLGKLSLTELKSVRQRLPHKQNLSRVERGRAISNVLQEAIEQLRPEENAPKFSNDNQYYTILHRAYIQGMKNDAIAKAIGLSTRTFYRQHANAILAIAGILSDWEE